MIQRGNLKLPVIELSFRSGDPTQRSKWIANYMRRTVLPCRDIFCCGDFSETIEPDRYYTVTLVPQTTRFSEVYIAHRYVAPPDRSEFKDLFLEDGAEVTLGSSGARLYFLGGIGKAGNSTCAMIVKDKQAVMIDAGVNVALLDRPKPTEIDPEEAQEEEIEPELYPDFDRAIRLLKAEGITLEAIFFTHGHLDHIGGVWELINRLELAGLKPPIIFGHRFTTALVNHQLEKGDLESLHKLRPGLEIRAIDKNEYTFGGIIVRAFATFHSIPGSLGYAVSFGDEEGSVVFTGDCKARWDKPADTLMTKETFAGLGPVKLLIMDGTNAGRDGWAGLESEVEQGYIDIIENARGRVFVTFFSTHVTRIQRLVRLGHTMGKKVAVWGRSFGPNLAAADAVGITAVSYQTQDPGEADIVIITGCQANANSVAWRLSRGDHVADMEIGSSDTVVISALPIPGRKWAVNRMIRNFRELGARIIIDEVYPDALYRVPRNNVHVTGHGRSKDIATVIKACQAEYILPFHCGRPQMIAAAEIAANTIGIPESNLVLPSSNNITIHL